MNNIPSASSLSASVRVYRTLLVAYPKRFREHYETHMVQVFRDSFRETYHHNGIPGVVDLWIHTLFDLVFTALIERVSERSQIMFSPKVILWGGLAGLFSGMLWLISGFTSSSSGVVTVVLALVLSMGGLAGLYSRQAGQGGKLGLTGFALGITGIVIVLVFLLWSSASDLEGNLKRGAASLIPLILIYILGFAISGIGLVLLGIISLRAKTPHKWRVLPLGVGLLTIVQSITFWLIIYVPLTQGLAPWDPPYTHRFDTLNFAAHLLVGFGWMALGAMLAAEGDAQIPVAQPPSASI